MFYGKKTWSVSLATRNPSARPGTPRRSSSRPTSRSTTWRSWWPLRPCGPPPH